jgi:uncharacterized membrane protein YuzA (DUF378 family)
MKKYIQGKTWIDWLKVIVAVDIAAVGIGLIFQESFHILANILGPFSRIIFGILYLMVALAIIKIVFPGLVEDLKGSKAKSVEEVVDEEVTITEEVEDKPKETVGERIDNAAKKVNTFIQGRAEEVKEEVRKVLDEEEVSEAESQEMKSEEVVETEENSTEEH